MFPIPIVKNWTNNNYVFKECLKVHENLIVQIDYPKEWFIKS